MIEILTLRQSFERRELYGPGPPEVLASCNDGGCSSRRRRPASRDALARYSRRGPMELWTDRVCGPLLNVYLSPLCFVLGTPYDVARRVNLGLALLLMRVSTRMNGVWVNSAAYRLEGKQGMTSILFASRVPGGSWLHCVE